MTLPVSGGRQREAEAQQRQQREEHRQEHRQRGVFQQPCEQQVGVAGRVLRVQQIGGDGDDGGLTVRQGVDKQLLRGAQGRVAVRQSEVLEGDLVRLAVTDGQVAVAVVPGKLLGKGAGQILHHQPLLLLGDALAADDAVIIGAVVCQQPDVCQLCAEEVVRVVNGIAALILIERLAEVLPAVQKHVVVGENDHAGTAQNGQRTE